MSEKLVIIGAGGHGKVVADIAVRNGYQDIIFLDDQIDKKGYMDFQVRGTTEDLNRFADCDFIVAIGNQTIREQLQKRLKKSDMHIVTLVHPNATVAPDVSLGEGTVMMAGAVVNPGSTVGDGCILNTGCTVGHDNQISDYVHVSAGCHLAGTVSVGKSTWVGIGTIVSNNLNICGDCMIGAGTVIVRDIREPGTYFGVPAEKKEDHKGRKS